MKFIVSSKFTLSEERGFSGFVLGNFVRSVFTAFLSLAEGVSSFGDIDLFSTRMN